MKRFPLTFFLLLLVFAKSLPGQGVDPSRKGLPTKSARVVSYKMRVRLFPETHRLVGTQEIVYRNQTSGSTNELRFHLYLNAFKNLKSTHLRESDERVRNRYKDGEAFGQIDLNSCLWIGTVQRDGKEERIEKDLKPGFRFDAPDDGNLDDRTVLVVPLPQPLLPGKSVQLKTSFEAKLPKAYRRTGWGPGNFFMVAQWFPKLGVLEDAGGGKARWNCHQFHAWTEFYADFGVFDVTLDTPSGWPLGATGRKIEGPIPVDGRWERRRFIQEDVHDFAWTTDPDYRVHSFTFNGASGLDLKFVDLYRIALGYGDSEMALNDVAVRLLLHPEHDTALQVRRHKEAVFSALGFFGSRFGRYPYKTLTVVDSSQDDWPGGKLGGGMEYPTLITCGTRLFPHPRLLQPEGVTIHEFGHQFWYGLSGNNEFEASYLDEGWNSYSEGRCLDVIYGGRPEGDPVITQTYGAFLALKGRVPGKLLGFGSLGWNSLSKLEALPLTECLPSRWNAWLRKRGFDGRIFPNSRLIPSLRVLRDLPVLSAERDIPYRVLYADRLSFLRDPDKDPMFRFAWKYLDRSSYRVNSYPKPSTILSTLERMMGAEKWWPMMRRFHEQARFAHPKLSDFMALVKAFGGKEVHRIAKDCFFTTKSFDYGIERVRSSEALGGTEVIVRRFGNIIATVPVRFIFEKDGKRQTLDKEWAAMGQYQWTRFFFSSSELAQRGTLVEVFVDPPGRSDFEPSIGPAGIFLIDRNLLNNAWRKVKNPAAANRFGMKALFWVQSVLSYFGGLG